MTERPPFDLDVDHGIEAEVEQTVGIGGGWQPTPWWTWTLVLLAGGVAALLVAGEQLASADLGTSLRARSCDTSAVGGVLFLVLGGVLLGLAFACARLRVPGAVLVWDLGSLVLALPIPAALLAATLPGRLGCHASVTIAKVGLVGDALVGASGLALAGAAAVLCGAALASAAHVTWLAPIGAGVDQPPGIVELAIQEAEALEAEGAAARFHNVDSGQ
jgi:hypothetical protein